MPERRAWTRGAAARGVCAGVAGTAVMTCTLKLEQLALPRLRGPVDYDASEHVVTAATAVLRYRPHGSAGRTALFMLVHWGYGSCVAAAYPALRTRLGSRFRAATIFYLGCQSMAMTLFPILGGTPPPWRWRRSILISSLTQHAIYATTVCVAEHLLVEHDPECTVVPAGRRNEQAVASASTASWEVIRSPIE